MSIENDLKRIADSLEIIAGVADDKAVKSFAATVPLKGEAPAPVVEVTNKTEEPITVTVSVPAPAPIVDKELLVPKADTPAPAPAPEVTTQMTLDQLNTELVVQYNRLNKDRTMIDATIKGFCGETSASHLAITDYQAVLDKVKAL